MKTVTLHIEADHIRFLTVEGKRVLKWGTAPLEEGAVRDGMIADPAALGRHIEAQLAEAAATGRKAVASMGGLRCLPRVITLPNLKTALLDDAVRYQAERDLPIAVEELYLPWDRLEDDGAERKVFAVGVSKHPIDEGVRTLQAAGFKQRGIDLKPLALARAIDQPEAVIVDLEAQQFEVVLVADHVPLIMRTVNWDDETSSAEAKVDQVVAEVTRTVDFYNRGEPDYAIKEKTPVYFTGTLSADPDVVRLAESRIGHPVGKLETPLKGPEDFPAAEYAVNLGLAMGTAPKKRAKKRDAARSLDLTLETDSTRTNPLPLPVIVLAALAVFATAPLFLTYQASVDVGETISGLEQRLESINADVLEARSGVTPVSVIHETAATLREDARIVLGSTTGYADSLGLFSETLPGSAQLTSIELSDKEALLKGSAADRSSAIGYASSLEGTERFSDVNIASLRFREADEGVNPAVFKIVAGR